MKPFQKVTAVLLAAILLLSTVGCVPTSLTKQWSYKYNDDVLSAQQDIGVYIYALYQAYNQAKTYAEENEDYVEDEPFTDLEITDEDGNTAIASEWIKTEAEKIAVNIIAVDYLVAKHEATYDEATMKSYKSTAQDTWDMGPYASYGYYQPMSSELEPYGVSFNSFFEASYAAQIKQDALFGRMYDKDGVDPASDEELTKHFKKDYVAYSYISVNLYSSGTDESGNSISTAYGKKKMNKIIAAVEDAAKEVNNGSVKPTKALNNLANEYNAVDNLNTETVEALETTETNNEDLAKALKKLDTGEASAVTVGKDGDTPTVYLVIKHNINDYVDEYVKGDDHRASVLSTCKEDDFKKLIEDTTAELLESDALEANTSQLNKYKADLFYVKPEEETEAESE